MAKKNIATYFNFHKNTIRSGMASMRAAGWEKDECLDAMTAAIDAAINFEAIVPGAVGDALELADGPAIRALLEVLWNLLAKAEVKVKA